MAETLKDILNPSKKSVATLQFHAGAGPVPDSAKKSLTAIHKPPKRGQSIGNTGTGPGPAAPEADGRRKSQKRGQSVGNAGTAALEADGRRKSPETTFKLVEQTVAGNAGTIIKAEAVGMSTIARATSGFGQGTRPSAILKMEGLTPEMLEMEILKQQEQINRMAAFRKSAKKSHGNKSVANLDQRSSKGKERTGTSVRFHSGGGSSPSATRTVDEHPKPPKRGPGAPGASTFAARRKFTFKKNEEEDRPLRRDRLSAIKLIEKEWETVTSVRANNLHNVTKYKSRSTGMHVVHAKLQSPTVYGYFVFAHKCENGFGLPHVLQHMIFLGSKDYPYPGILDQLASKCFATGTDAWTDSDHACYTVKTAGKDGFLTILPILLDHVFFPTLTEAGFLTEAHHINGEGKEGGICYLEMKGIEHDALEQANWCLHRQIYNSQSGYFHNYGGNCKQMRESCTLGSVREFHKYFYHPKNFCLIICGDLDREEIFKVINPFNTILLEKNLVHPNWINPWEQEHTIKVPHEVESTIRFPSESEGASLVIVGIMGCAVTEDVTLAVGMDILIQYLLDSPVSPIQMEFVEHENALASRVHLTEMHHAHTIYCFNFENVPTNSQDNIPSLLRKMMERQYASEFDMERMEFIVSLCYQRALSEMENDAENTIAKAVISDFLYGFKEVGIIFDRRINHAYTIEQFTNQPKTFWLRMMKLLLDMNWATVYAMPSMDIGETFRQEDNLRSKEINERLGDIGRKKLGNRLKAAIKIQSKPPPPEVLDALSLPAISSIGFLGIERIANPEWASDTLCNLFLDDINSSYVYLTVIMDTSELTLEEKKYLCLFAEALLEAPYVDNSQKYYTYDQLIAGISRDVLKYETFFGLDWDNSTGTRFSCGSYSHLLCIRFQMEMKKVKEAFEWMQILLWNTTWQPDRLKLIAQRLANDVHIMKDRGATMTQAMLAERLYHMNSNVKAMGLVRQQVFLERMARELPKSFKKVAKMLEHIRMVILRPENTTVHVATSLPKMEFYLTDKPEIQDAIPQLLRRTFDYTGWHWGYQTKRLANDPDYIWMKSTSCINKCATEQILRMHSDEGSYLIQVCPCIREYTSPEYPTLLVAIQYFCQQTEGPFYQPIKESGTTNYNMILKPQEGMIYFEIKGSVDLVYAYYEVFKIILQHIGDDTVWDDNLLICAKSSAIFELIEKENTPRSLSLNSLLVYYRQVPPNFTRSVMEKIILVGMEDVKEMTRKYFRNLFIETTTCAVAAPEEKVPEIIKGLMDNCGKRLALLPPVNQSEMAAFV